MGCQPWGGMHGFPDRGPECPGTAGPMAAWVLSEAEFRRSSEFPPAQYPVCPPTLQQHRSSRSHFSARPARVKSRCTISYLSTPDNNTPLLESLNNWREGQPRPGTGFGLGPPYWGLVWTHFALFSFKICVQTTSCCCAGSSDIKR